jgi:chromosome partitioning protein
MTVVALVSNKGGAGKTTLAMNLAAGLSRRTATVVIDADPQQSSWQWSRVSELSGHDSGRVIEAGDTLSVTVDRHRSDYDYLIVDCPPSIQAEQTREALELADLALVPVQPSPLDVWATSHIAEAVREARGVNRRLKAFLIINQLEPRTRLSRALGKALGTLELPTLETTVRRRSVYRNCLLDGRDVYSIGARGRAAAQEMEDLITEVLQP